MTSMPPNDREPAPPPSRPTDSTVTPVGDELEPDWAEEIRARRRARGERLREVFATFDDEPDRPPPDPQEPPK